MKPSLSSQELQFTETIPGGKENFFCWSGDNLIHDVFLRSNNEVMALFNFKPMFENVSGGNRNRQT